MRCVEPVKVIEILRLTEQGYSQREIARSVKCGKSTVADVFDVSEQAMSIRLKSLGLI